VACTKTGSKNDLFLNCRRKPKELSKKELSNVAPALEFMTVHKNPEFFQNVDFVDFSRFSAQINMSGQSIGHYE
jgi:hypothetical protein